MPIYEYNCTRCGKIEILQSITDKPREICPVCHTGKLTKLIPGSVGVIFKGRGFYKTDNRKEKS